ncbi:TcdA/TcdB pore-forming domain-containing protein [Pseudomonas sp. FP2196]|uniref:TcdA/TcdB pore-forming domain-containing protein n=1 Tax=Pseudomonas sp. FP2196 TaxID=2954086 RepID=UPI00273331B6|nr:TcdA/TcdB pore-forming domain-containing protein [Pseudomonas sp. FP2196]WLH36292.1 TcdA/TcdB pore-forming domain-containing protein [Pseudomonas sp. FP2196]
MSNVEAISNDNYVNFSELFRRTDFERALSLHKESKHYEALLRYYSACVSANDPQQLIEPLRLLRQTLQQLLGNSRVRRELEPPVATIEKPAAELSRIYDKVEAFESRVHLGVELIKTVSTPVPKTLHFVWLGGGVGPIQRDYLNVWKQVLTGQGYTLNLWFDSDALLAYQTNKLIVEAAKADALAQVAGKAIAEDALADLYEARAIVLKQQMQAHIDAAVANGQSADDARIDLLVSAYGQDEAQLQALREQHRRSLQGISGGDLQLRDLDNATTPLQLQDIYEREIRLRGNLAAASDVVRAEVLHGEGGSYADVDNLPPLVENLSGVDLNVLSVDARLGILQLLLNHNPEWMPGRQSSNSYAKRIPAEHLATLEAFAKSGPALSQVFQAPTDLLARPFMLRAVAEGSSMTNAFLMAHAGSATLQAVIERIRFNYRLVDETLQLAAQRNVALTDFDGVLPLALTVLEKTYGPLRELPNQEEILAGFLASAAASYFSDGIRPQSEGTIYLTGPGAIRDGMADYAKAHLTPGQAEMIRAEASIARYASVNRATEEELDHSWKDNANDPVKWVEDEQARWQQGQYTTRYKGDIAQLLKGSTIEFEQGWPLIEGRAVLLTDVLQRLVDGLGEPFTEAMRQGHDGAIGFEKLLPLSFADRQLIRNQPLNARPPVFLNDQRLRNLGLDEVLSALAHGELSLVETTPLQRLSLGVLLGIDSLHSQNFDRFSGELDNLANSVRELGASNRYAVIERRLYSRRDAQFLSGLAGDIAESAASISALDLKKSALMKAQTLQQWGRYAAQIQQTATLEHRLQISERMDQVLGQIEASSVKPVPQDLLLGGAGEAIGGRCYPLALMMAAAFATGEMASHRLRERFYLSVIEPQQSDSQAFVQVLEELRSAQLSEVGTTLSRADLTQLTAALESDASPRTLMLNTDNHSMLVAKTVVGAQDLYHFYDPNFGLFEFESAAMFKRALEHFFLKVGMAKYYAAYGGSVRPTFDLIELDGAKVAALPLSGGIDVAKVLTNDALPGQTPGKLRQRLNSAHGRSLVDNLHLGASLLGLDGHWWGRQIAGATTALQELHPSVTPWVPLFETLEITAEGKYRLSLVDSSTPEHVVQVVSDDHRLLRIKNWLSEQFSTLARKPLDSVGVLDPTEAGAVHTLNAGFSIQALMNALRGREGEDRTLTTAVRLHAYLNYAQLVHGNVVDVVGLIQLVKTALGEEKIIARTCASVVTEALGHAANEGVGAVLGLANVGFDIYQLASAQNDIEKAQFGTQLAFDSASLALTAGGVGAAVAGASTAAAVLGGAGVILGGLAVGVAALAQGFAGIARNAQEVGTFFADMEDAYRGLGYHFDDALGAWITHPSLIVKSIDLAAGKVLFDSQKLYPLRDHFGVPDFDSDYARAINIRQQLGLPGQIEFLPAARQTIVLPCTPQTCYGYEYKALPFASSRHDRGFDTARRLERKLADGQWLFLFSFYSFPSHYIVHRLFPQYRDTVIDVHLDAVERTLVVPSLPTAWRGKVSYRISSAGASCSVLLNHGASIELHAPSRSQSRWVLQAGWASEESIRIEPCGELYIGDVHVKISGHGRHSVLIRTANQQLFSVDFGERQLNIIQQSAHEGLDEQALLKHYKILAREHRLVMPYTPVHDWLIPFESPQEPRYTTAWYDAREERFLYIRNEKIADTEDAQLALVANGFAYFYLTDSYDIWQVDVVSGLLKVRYRLLLPEGKSAIGPVEVDEHGVIHLIQTVSSPQGTRRFNYLIHQERLLLSSVTHAMARELQASAFAHESLADWSTVLGKYTMAHPSAERDGATTVDWQPATYVSVSWKFAPDRRDIVWVRSRDRLLIHPLPLPRHTRGWPDSIKNLTDLVLLPMAGASDVYFIYNRLDQVLCRLQRDGMQGQQQWSHRWVEPEGLKHIVAVENGYLILDEEGRLFNLTAQGEAQLHGVGEQWLKGRAHWWQALEPIAKRYPVERFAIVGLRNAAGDGQLSAWHMSNRVLLCDPGRDKPVRLLGMTPDNRTAWLFSVSEGEIWRQAFVDPQQLDRAFGEGQQLLHHDALPVPERVWSAWNFAEVTVDGAGLQGTTVEGVTLQLGHQQAPVVIGVESRWVTAQGACLIERLQALLARADHGGFVSVASGPDHLQWYDVQSARLVSIAATDLPKDFVMLGTQNQFKVLLHQRREAMVRIYPGMHSIGPFDYIQRNAYVLTVEGRSRMNDLLSLLPDDINTLVVRLGQGGVTCHLSKAAWQRLDTVIVDCRHALGEVPAVPGKLHWDFESPEKLLFEIVEEHLVIVDPETEHTLIFRDVCSPDPALRGEVFLAFGKQQSHAISAWVQRMQARTARTANVTLQALLAEPAAG